MTDERHDFPSEEEKVVQDNNGNEQTSPFRQENTSEKETSDQFRATPNQFNGNGWQNPNGFYYSNQNQFGGNAPQEPKPPRKKGPGFWIAILLALYLVLLGSVFALISSGTLVLMNGEEGEESTTTVETGENAKTEEKKEPSHAPIVENPSTNGENAIVGEDYTGNTLTATELYEQNVESVVFVTANYRMGTATGSGFVIDSVNGYILTNYHVVEDCDDIAVTLRNGDSYTAEYIGGDEINDVAVLKVEAQGLRHVTLADSDHVKVGQDVLIIGNPLGDLTFTLTKGIVSAVDRSINTGEYNIMTFQTDAAINSGNSGGPAFDATGAVIGIASAKYASTGVEGIGFCIPINDAMEVARDLVEFGYVKGRPNFGIAVSDSAGYEYTTDEYGRRVLIETKKGARVEEVGKDSCANRAGIKVGDIITKLDDVKVETATALINAKNAHKAGDTVTLEIYRSGEIITIQVTLDEYSPD